MAIPDSDREQHDIASRKTRNRQGAKKFPAALLVPVDGCIGIERHSAITKILNRADVVFGL